MRFASPSTCRICPWPRPDPVLSLIVTAHADQALQALDRVCELLVTRVRQLVAASLGAGLASMDHIARRQRASRHSGLGAELCQGHRMWGTVLSARPRHCTLQTGQTTSYEPDNPFALPTRNKVSKRLAVPP